MLLYYINNISIGVYRDTNKIIYTYYKVKRTNCLYGLQGGNYGYYSGSSSVYLLCLDVVGVLNITVRVLCKVTLSTFMVGCMLLIVAYCYILCSKCNSVAHFMTSKRILLETCEGIYAKVETLSVPIALPRSARF